MLLDLLDGFFCDELLWSEIVKDLVWFCYCLYVGDLIVLGWGIKGECWMFV